jgi:hypothetical protein
MSHSPTCRGCAALAERTKHWRETGQLTEQDIHDFQEDHTIMNDYSAPDGYRIAMQARAASAHKTPEQTFAERYAEERTRAFEEEATRRAAHFAAHPSPPRLTTAETAAYAPPNPYPALDKMKKSRR